MKHPKGSGAGRARSAYSRFASDRPHTDVHAIDVDPHRSMKAATQELEVTLDLLGAELDPEARRAVALLATELVAQVVGRELDRRATPVRLLVTVTPEVVRLEAVGSAARSRKAGVENGVAGGLADWGNYVLARLATRWGAEDGDPPVLWAEVRRSRDQG